MWYINEDFTDVNNTTLERFILTMWYINHITEGETNEEYHGFILTMWYINLRLYVNDLY